MDMNAEFINLYVERLVKEIGELNKSILLKDTQLTYAQMSNKKLIEENESLRKKAERKTSKKKDGSTF